MFRLVLRPSLPERPCRREVMLICAWAFQITFSPTSSFYRLQPANSLSQKRRATGVASMLDSISAAELRMKIASAGDREMASRRSKIAHSCAYSFGKFSGPWLMWDPWSNFLGPSGRLTHCRRCGVISCLY